MNKGQSPKATPVGSLLLACLNQLAAENEPELKVRLEQSCWVTGIQESQEMVQKQRGRGRTYCPHPRLIQIVTLQWCLHPTYVVLSSHLLCMKEQEEKRTSG